jgi:hypothetical protein
MTRLPRLLDLGSFPALALTILAAVSCGGRVDSSGGEGSGPTQRSGSSSSSSSPTGSDADAAGDAGAANAASDAGAVSSGGLTCTDPIHVSIGETISGTTCGGATAPETICFVNGTIAFIQVDAPSGAGFHLEATPNIAWAGYVDCATPPMVCGGTMSTLPAANVQIYGVEIEVMDDAGEISSGNGGCGDFTITVVSQ